MKETKKTTEKKTPGKTGLQNTRSGGGVQVVPPDVGQRRREKGCFVQTPVSQGMHRTSDECLVSGEHRTQKFDPENA